MVHGSGSTWNDTLDRAIDREASRTRSRPMARGAVSVPNALAFFVFQIILGAGLVWRLLSWECVLWSTPVLVGGLIYPLGKRFTHYPQVILGSVFSWGVLLAFPAVNVQVPSSGAPLLSVASLYVASVSWTVLYDTIYALQDLEDDLKNGVKSTAVRHAHHIKPFLGMLAAVEVSALGLTGMFIGSGLFFLSWTCVASGTILTTMIWKLNIEDSQDCLWWFSNQCYLVGSTIFAGFLGEYVIKLSQE